MSQNEHSLHALEAWIDQTRAWITDTASTSALGGDPAWDAVLSQLGIPPLSREERARHVAEGPKRLRGALPLEVRTAIGVVEERARAALRPLDFSANPPEEETVVRSIEQKLMNLVEGTMKDMLARVSPPAPTTSSIFANAKATTPNYAAMGVKAGATQMKCTTCGAPRKPGADGAAVNDGAAIAPCAYCGGKVA